MVYFSIFQILLKYFVGNYFKPFIISENRGKLKNYIENIECKPCMLKAIAKFELRVILFSLFIINDF